MYLVSGGSDRKCKLQADDADLQEEIAKKQTQLVRRRRRAQHRQRKLANKIATYNQDDDANSSSSSSSSFTAEWLLDATIRISRSIAEDLAIADYTQVWRITKHWKPIGDAPTWWCPIGEL